MASQKVEQQLKEVGSKLDSSPSSKDALVKLLKQAASCLSELDQSPPATTLESMQPFLNAIVKPELLKHQDRDVKLLVATCICEITRITAPEAPYSDDVLKDVFRLIVGTFSGLKDTSGPSFGRRVVILETLAKYRSCVVMLDLECDDLVTEMFSTFFAVARDDHHESVLSAMQTIMIVLLEESEDLQDDLLFVILSVLGRKRSDITVAARRLAMNVIEQSAGKLESGIRQFLISSMSGDNKSTDHQIDYHEVIYDVYRSAPQIVSAVVPYLTGELLTDQLDTRLKAVNLVGDLFSLPGSTISEPFQPIFSEFLKRLTDRVVEVRMSVLEHVKSCMLSNPFRAEAPEIISALCDRLLDYEEKVRKQVVAVIYDVACHDLNSIPLETVKLVAERLRDKSVLVKKYTMERLAEIYRVYCAKCSDGSTISSEFEWIPGKILRCIYDKDFRSDTIENVLCESLFPTEFSIKDKVKHWVRVFSVFDKVEVKALEKILEQKQRLLQEMQKYMSLRQVHQDGDAPEIQKKILFCFRIMARSFADPAKAEENFQFLDQLKDANIWKILMNLVDPNTSFHQARTLRDELLKILGEKHRLYDFLSTLSVKCSYLLFNKEHVKEILLEVAMHRSTADIQYKLSCMNILVILARFSPLLLSGTEEELVNFLKDDDEAIKEGVLNVLAKAGGTIRENLAALSSSIDLILERLCLEGSRRQAKYAVHALAAITKDDGLKSLSVLYKRLVDMLEEKTHLPAVLQSLGCIAETAMPVFETRESEIEKFITEKILKSNDKPGDNKKASWDDKSELCALKIYGIKTLVKSYLPVKDAQVRPGIDGLLEILRNTLSCGEISKDIESSSIDKAHLRLASAKAVLRLSKHWNHKIPVDVFHLTLKVSEISFPQARRLFLNKVHQYIKDRLLDAKYTCAFFFNMFGLKSAEFQEEKQNLADIIQMYHQTKARHLSIQSDANSLTAYPEYILPYLVHVLAHHCCPNIDDSKDDVKAFEPIYRQLHLFLSMLLHKDEDVKSESTSNIEKEDLSAIVSIFQSIKSSEDIYDVVKSKNSHAICDLGLSITKRLAPKEIDLQVLTTSVPLPSMLYKPYEKKEGDDSVASEAQTWLADDSVLAHFESLKLDTTETDISVIAEDEVLIDGEKDGKEVPLGKIIKHLKSQKNKAKKENKNKVSSANPEKAENDVDILNMVREINLDNLGESSKFESSNGHENLPSRKSRTDTKHQKANKRKTSDGASVAVPKRRRSSTAHGAFKSPRSTSKSPLSASLDDSLNRKLGESTESALLVSCIRKNATSSSKRKSRGSDPVLHDEENEVGADSDHDEPDVLEAGKNDPNSGYQSPTGPIKKRKKKSMSGSTKSKFKEGGKDIEDLIGCRIKVWWPMDKAFYEGTVKSYDTLKRKHVVLYADGDVEVLRLENERWELIDNGRKPTKKSNSSKKSPSKEVSPGQKSKSAGSSRKSKKLTKTVKGKRTPSKILDGKRGRSKRKQWGSRERESSDVSNIEPNLVSKVDEMNSGSSGGAERKDANVSDEVDSDKEVKSVSKGNLLEGADCPNPNIEDSDEEMPDSEGRPAKDMDSIGQDAQNNGDEKLPSEETETEEVNRASSREGNEEDSSDSEGNQEKDDVRGGRTKQKKPHLPVEPSSPSVAGDLELSDDEPLGNFTLRVGKRASKSVR
ncbi:PREDICTED: sister chromatid cohesion protein PDS5 homolog A [Fragaria vesca subsp. vesca]|uniref:sister chromatid cohesion protein PDS5 homolog A n=1 Tax=Fragaria vesca subsp. vesca TaxID=101020 RepID=UPI0002C32ACD|nr:PREDICTED: sister chromatid cohesion protein PDS5 homolog A [Fragaria vesca subsp. vesca]